jgi:hypothetical protein
MDLLLLGGFRLSFFSIFGSLVQDEADMHCFLVTTVQTFSIEGIRNE